MLLLSTSKSPLAFKAAGSSHRATRPLVVKALALPETYG